MSRVVRGAPHNVLHLVSRVTDEVMSFLSPATRELADRGEQQSVVVLDDPINRNNVRQLGKYAKTVLVKSRTNKVGQYRDLYRACVFELARCEPRAFHLHGMVACIIGSLALKTSGIELSVLYSPHGSRSLSSLRLAGWLTLRAGCALIHPSRNSAIATFLPETSSLTSWGETFVVESPVDDIYLAPRRHESTKPLVIGGGADADGKAAETMAQIAVLLSADEFEIGFKWLGDADTQARARFSAANIEILDANSLPLHAEALFEAWIYFAPSWKRSYPLLLIQAMATGVPCVAADCPQHRQVIEHGITGYLYSSESEMITAIAALLDERALRKRIGNAAKESIRKRFSGDEFRTRLLRSYAAARA